MALCELRYMIVVTTAGGHGYLIKKCWQCNVNVSGSGLSEASAICQSQNDIFITILINAAGMAHTSAVK